jgi:hypothetical protein
MHIKLKTQSLGGWDTLMRRSNSFPIRPAPGPPRYAPVVCFVRSSALPASRNRLIIVLLVHLLSFCSIIERSIKEPRSGVSALPAAAIFVFTKMLRRIHFKERVVGCRAFLFGRVIDRPTGPPAPPARICDPKYVDCMNNAWL